MTLNHLFSIPEKTAITERGLRPLRQFPAIAGVDLSMTKTGVAVFRPDPVPALDKPVTDLRRILSSPIQNGRDAKGKPAATWEDRRVRMADIVRRVSEAVPDGSLVFLEAPSYGSTGSGTFDRSGLWWWVFSELTALECLVVPVSPAQRMQYATGKGGGKDAGKDAVIAGVVRAYPELAVTDNNVADATVLLMMARRWAGVPHPAKLAAANLKAMDKLPTPDAVGVLPS